MLTQRRLETKSLPEANQTLRFCNAQIVSLKGTLTRAWIGEQKAKSTPGKSFLVNTGLDDWTNQRPLTSEVGGPHSYKSRQIGK